jgi:hypothetical protein
MTNGGKTETQSPFVVPLEKQKQFTGRTRLRSGTRESKTDSKNIPLTPEAGCH